MTLSRVWSFLAALYLLVAFGAAVAIAVPTTSEEGRPSGHLAPASVSLAPCGDMYKGCVQQWKATSSIALSVDPTTDFPSANLLKLEKRSQGPAEVSLEMVPSAGKVNLHARFRREGAITAEMGLTQAAGGQAGLWRSFGPLSWEPSGFPGWASHESVVTLPADKRPTRFVLRLVGTGTVWLQQVRLRSEP